MSWGLGRVRNEDIFSSTIMDKILQTNSQKLNKIDVSSYCFTADFL